MTQVFIFLRYDSDNEYIDPKAGSFYLLTPRSCPCHWPCLVCPSHRSHTVHVTMWHCLYWDFSISFFLLRGIGGNGIQQRWCQAYSRLLNDLWYSASHVLSMMFVLSDFHTWTWRLCRERDALSSLPRRAGSGCLIDREAGYTSHQWRSHDHRMRYVNYTTTN